MGSNSYGLGRAQRKGVRSPWQCTLSHWCHCPDTCSPCAGKCGMPTTRLGETNWRRCECGSMSQSGQGREVHSGDQGWQNEQIYKIFKGIMSSANSAFISKPLVRLIQRQMFDFDLRELAVDMKALRAQVDAIFGQTGTDEAERYPGARLSP